MPIEILDYDDAGRVETVTDARNQATRYTLDAGGARLTETRALGFVQRWTYTPWGGVKTQTDADGLSTTFDYDIRQRLTKQTDPGVGPTSHGYDLANNRIETERPGGAVWGFDYDGADRLVAVDSPEGHTTVYGYDRHGNRERSQDAAGHATVYRFDARHRLIAIDHPIGGDEVFVHNGEGERTSHTDRSGQTITLSVDGLGRTTARSYSAAAPGDIGTESFQLDGDGRPTQLSQSGGSDGIALTQRRYNGQGWLETETDRYGQRTVWTHDEVGNRTRREDPAGITSYQPDALNRTTAVTVPGAGSTSLDYTPAGRLEQITHPNGASSRYSYDDAGRVETITHSHSGAQVARFEYRYDLRGNRERETRIDGSGGSARTQVTDYRYDRDDRLTETSVLGTDNSVTQTVYTLDAVGNRTREEVRRGSVLSADISYTYQAHQRLTQTQDSVSGITTEYTYDHRGHLITETTNGQTTTYRPNAQDRLATLTLPGAPPVHYSYDAEGKRVERRTHTDVTRFGWDGATLRRETNAANNVLEAHDWAAGRILASRSLSDTRYAQHDALRSPIRWSRSNGAEAGQLRYDAWGDTTASATDLPRIAYTGHYREREGTAYYAQQRYYRPGLGRFNRVDPATPDPLWPITANPYVYAAGNPLAFVDPDGRASRWASEDDIPHGASYWAINRGGRVQYWNTSADAYSDASNYQIARNMATSIGATAQAMERGMLDRLSRWATGADAEPASGQGAPHAMLVAESSSGADGVQVDIQASEVQRRNQLHGGLNRGIDGVKQGAEIAQQVGCGLHVVCSAHEAITGRDQSGVQLSGVERGMAAAPVGLALLKIGGDVASAAVKADGALSQAGGGMPSWLQRLFRDGDDFNKRQHSRYPYNEVYVERSCGQGACLRLDSYNPSGGETGAGEIVSRKFTQLSEVQMDTVVGYLREFERKYPPGTVIADVPSNRASGLAGRTLQGQMYLEVPVQSAPVPQQLIDEAARRRIIIRDELGNEY